MDNDTNGHEIYWIRREGGVADRVSVDLEKYGIDVIKRSNDTVIDNSATIQENTDIYYEIVKNSKNYPLLVTDGIKTWTYRYPAEPLVNSAFFMFFTSIIVNDNKKREELEEAKKEARFAIIYGWSLEEFENRGVSRVLRGRWDVKKAEEIIRRYRSGIDMYVADPIHVLVAMDIVAEVKGYEYLKENYGDALKMMNCHIDLSKEDVERNLGLKLKDFKYFKHVEPAEKSKGLAKKFSRLEKWFRRGR